MAFISIAVEVLISLILGVLTNYLVDSKEVASLIGISSFLCIELVKIRITTDKNSKDIEWIRALVESWIPADSFAELSLIYFLRSSAVLSKGTISVNKDQVRDFWKDCISRTSSKWNALSYTKAKDTWNLGWGGTSALSIQKERVENKCHIQRVFVVDSNEELLSLSRIMEEQKNIGVEVAYVMSKELLSNPNCREAYEQLGTLDLCICDSYWVYRTLLDRQRNMIGASASRSPDVMKKAEFLLREANRLSKKYNQ